MRKALRICLALAALAALVSGCAADVTEEPSPSPTVTAAPTEMPTEEPSPSAEATQSGQDDEAFAPVGDDAEITVGTTKLEAGAYTGGGETPFFPLAETAKALGWTVSEPDATVPVTMRLTRDGADEVTIAYTAPEGEGPAAIADFIAAKAGETINLGGESLLAFIDSTLYATEDFLDKAIQEVDVDDSDRTKITIEAKA